MRQQSWLSIKWGVMTPLLVRERLSQRENEKKRNMCRRTSMERSIAIMVDLKKGIDSRY